VAVIIAGALLVIVAAVAVEVVVVVVIVVAVAVLVLAVVVIVVAVLVLAAAAAVVVVVVNAILVPMFLHPTLSHLTFAVSVHSAHFLSLCCLISQWPADGCPTLHAFSYRGKVEVYIHIVSNVFI
jgi:hypothetical protein